MDKIKVLVVDDHALMRDGIRALLGLHDDIEIVGEAAEGREAIKKARELEPDVIVMDIAMPDMNGLEATRRIVKNNPRIKVLILTQYDNREHVLSSVKAGAVDYVPKRAIGSELVSAIYNIQREDSFLSTRLSKAVVEHLRQQAEKVEPHDRLTVREREILKLVASGHTSREVATILSISLKTVLNHRMKIMKKLDVHTHTGLIKYCIRKKLISVD